MFPARSEPNLDLTRKPHLLSAYQLLSLCAVAFPSNLQVRMMKELIERAVEHVAHNASQEGSVDLPAEDFPPLPVLGAAPVVSSSWWPSFWRVGG